MLYYIIVLYSNTVKQYTVYLIINYDIHTYNILYFNYDDWFCFHLVCVINLSTCSLQESVFPPPDCLICEKKLSSGSWENRLGTHLRLTLPSTYVCMMSYMEWQVLCRSPWSWCVINILDFWDLVRSGKLEIQLSQSLNHLDITTHLSGLLNRMVLPAGTIWSLFNRVSCSK